MIPVQFMWSDSIQINADLIDGVDILDTIFSYEGWRVLLNTSDK